MVTEEGVVERIQSTSAFVKLRKSSACSSCESHGACHIISDKEMLIEVPNTLDAGVGDRVEISVPTRSLLKLSLLVYFFPIIMFVAGAVLGGQWGEASHKDPSLMSIAGGIIAMAGSFLVLKRLDRFAGGREELHPRMTRILPNEDLLQLDDSI